jgi:hypothetical protein
MANLFTGRNESDTIGFKSGIKGCRSGKGPSSIFLRAFHVMVGCFPWQCPTIV